MAWKFYFWFMLALDMAAFIWPTARRPWETIEPVFFVSALIGLFGFCWQKATISRLFWQVFLFVFLVWMAAYIFIAAPLPSVLDLSGRTHLPVRLVSSFAIIPYAPLIVALYLYAFKRPDIW
jgi:hypothetical protein